MHKKFLAPPGVIAAVLRRSSERSRFVQQTRSESAIPVTAVISEVTKNLLNYVEAIPEEPSKPEECVLKMVPKWNFPNGLSPGL